MAELKGRAKRQLVNQEGMIYALDGKQIAPCRLRNVSATGAQIELSREIEVPAKFLLALSQSGSVRRRCITVWQYSVVIGVRFDAARS